MENTSAEAWNEVGDGASLELDRAMVLKVVRQYPDWCANEYDAAHPDFPAGGHKRLSGARPRRLCPKGPSRVSRVSGKRCATWFAVEKTN